MTLLIAWPSLIIYSYIVVSPVAEPGRVVREAARGTECEPVREREKETLPASSMTVILDPDRDTDTPVTSGGMRKYDNVDTCMRSICV